jgi:syntaxin 18
LTITEPPISRRRRAETTDDWTHWQGVKYLSDRDREEIDQRGKMILRRCKERVGILEDGEKGEIETNALMAARQNEVAPPPSTLFTFLPSLAKPASKADAVLTAHRAAVILTLSTMLSRTTAALSDLQEERSKRRAERGRTLGEGAEREAQQPMLPQVAEDLNLSQAQIQAFESENNALMTHLESTLSSVLKAERSLLEVSELQTQLVQQLVQQTEMVDLLYDQAVGSVGEMKGAAQQLKRAKERGGESRFFLLIFLVGASLALLFLDWYK